MNDSEAVAARAHRSWRAPRLSNGKPALVPDHAAHALEDLARAAAARAPVILSGIEAGLSSGVEGCGYVDLPEISDRAWRFTHASFEIYCVIDERCEREFLSLIIGGSPAVRLSAIERSIVAESISRMLASGDEPRPDFCEEPRKRPPSQAWRCVVELRGQRNKAQLRLFTACVPPPRVALPSSALSDVPLHLRAMFPATACAVTDILKWRSGSLLRLRRPAREVCALLCAGGRRLAIGHIGVLLGDRALKLIQVYAGTQ